MILTYILFVIGFFFLIKGADLLVDGASSVAKKFGISALVIGLTIVSFGTSMPELIVNIFASINGNTDIAIGNILGSNIANILLILGVSAIIYPLAVKKGTAWKEIPFSFLAVIVLAIMANDVFLDKTSYSAITRIDGFILLSFFIIFMYYIFSISKTGANETQEKEPKIYSPLKSTLMIIAGLIGLTFGGKWIVDGAVAFASSFGVSQALIGLTVVAVGTSLPELATSAVAAYKKNVDIAVGNVVGSNIFNIFWILGVSAIIKPLPFSSIMMIDVFMTVFATTALFAFLFIGKKHILERWQGVCFILFYIIYIIYLIFRG
ncbi:MAG: sodium:proton exchanger [Candidatus Staskawiczbacteria bacterium RIFOXYB2_FULL_32_9]|uniref:Sodium:proton exchanger n=1 Tax=Candidatus Staskawiczbacteria bacterium RIFOXYD1_FULL_32_13 TaxID=1802234 RepID=A0A1G2JQN8_9BACT|nr:MAG: Na+/Ca+ antiporter, CaCA family [Parcubacteria group bacterium GW2011_GWC2_32_10]OGZ80201.1 MAG: sodium:proton exchanger [Candidatus Staskawiczbacteria bacterium RIFOXYA2_FULL_32_7]OGZ80753.1 MAG: sodium:proton exchanger [Candidatus Staskawiczbacteria bacterium RIFOXYB1_FULL_32_11]OGZ82289.1 MAG: sodium:proton exchanger [Candidatus Staskawiczbacteria bacterium RIFOXYB2_FULL_32_9]OGZ86872.1 MAG: sodium:proton exchanger [Candidatus Staskawiczbacteria bacterium RIFOXYC2_FULL_32_10]OGZ8945